MGLLDVASIGAPHINTIPEVWLNWAVNGTESRLGGDFAFLEDETREGFQANFPLTLRQTSGR